MKLPRGHNGIWTTLPYGYMGNDATDLALGDTCSFFSCYQYAINKIVEGLTHKEIHLFSGYSTSCIIGESQYDSKMLQCVVRQCQMWAVATLVAEKTLCIW